MSEEIYLADWEEEALRRAEEEREALEEERSKGEQFSITDPPDRDRPTSQPAKAKDATAAAAPAIASEVRRRLDKLLKKKRLTTLDERLGIVSAIEQLLRESSQLTAETLYGAILDSWLGGATHALDGLPDDWQPTPIPLIPGQPPPEPPAAPPAAGDFFDGGEPPIGVSLTAIDNAIAALSTRQVLQPEEYYALAGAAKQKAFSITADLTNESITKFRDALAADVTEGPSLGSFRDRVLEEFDVLPLAENHLEQVYRNNINEAFSQGMEQVLDHPLVEDAFPYRRYVPIHDARCRPEHAQLF